jgi:general secretion pathway protein B
MSLILEALRKSEAERRRAQAPDLFAEPQLALPRPHPTWPRWTKPVLAGVGLIALLVLLRAMWPQATPVASTQRPQPVIVQQHAPASTIPREPASSQTTAAATPRQRSWKSAAPASVPPNTGQAKPAIPAPIVEAPALEPPRMQQEPIAAAEVQPAPVPATVAAPVSEPADDTMRLSDLGAEERQQLPTLKLSMHMWNDTPAQRFVILDGQRLGEGDRIGAAVVEQITRDGAILAWNGRRLRVSMR